MTTIWAEQRHEIRVKKIKVKFLAKVTTSLTLIALVLSYVDLSQTLETLAGIKFSYLIIPIFISFLQTATSSYKWKIILSIEGFAVKFIYLFKTYLIGQFISLFLPTGIGGDIYRIAAIKRTVGDFSSGAATVIFDRVSGLYALLVLAVTGSFALVSNEVTFWLIAIVLFAPVFVLIFTKSRVVSTLGSSRSQALKSLGRIIASQRKFILSKKVIAVVILSITFQSIAIFVNYLYCQALSIDISLTHLWAIIPLIYLTDMIPFSINGIGIRDSAFVFFFVLLGYSAEEALALSITLISMRYLVCISGGGLLLREFLLGRKIL